MAAPPAGFVAMPGTNQITLIWNAVTGATNYLVQRALDFNGTYTVIANTGSTTNFTDTVVSDGMTYYYAVASVSNGTPSGFTPPAGVSPFSAYALPTGLPFAKGADASWVSQMESNGYSWFNRDGTPQDVFQILKTLGVNAIRLRVWVNPPAGYNNKEDVIAKALRAKNAGQRVMLDFHYSDGWADPGQQTKPAAWANFNTAQLIAAVSNHTADVMSGVQAAGVNVEWAAVGNEISCGLLWPDGFTCGATNNTTNLVALINSGYGAVKAVNPATRVILHLNNGQSNYRWWFDPAVNLGARFDVIGLSVYPATTTNWIADTTNALANMLDISTRYGKEVVVAETGMAANAPQNCQDMLVDLMNRTRSVPNSKGLGLFYWEPEAYAYWGQSAWNGNGKPTIAMDAFAYEPNQPPGSPALSGTVVAGQMQLTWTIPVSATNYNVKRATISGGPYTTLATLAATNYINNLPQTETPYFYVASAVNAFGEGVNSSEVTGIITTNQVARYAFEGNALDSSASANHGINNGATFVTGKVGTQAAQFNGSNAWVQIPVSIGKTNFTIALWIKTTDTGSSGQWYAGEGLVDGEVAGTVNDFGTALSGGKFAFGIGNPDTTLTSSTAVNNGAWHHVAATWDAASGAMKVYVDGNLNASGTGPTGSRNAVTDNLHLGNSHNGGHYFNGSLDDVQLFAHALSAPEISSLAGTVAPAIPAGLAASAGNARVGLTWNSAIGATGYLLTRALSAGGPFVTIAPTAATGFNDLKVINGTNYFYAITATNSFGSSANSAPVAATPVAPAIQASLTSGGEQLALSWPLWASNYSALTATNLDFPITWTAVTNGVISSNGLYYLLLPATNRAQQFFRLGGS